MDILRIEEKKTKNLLSIIAEKALRKAIGKSVKDFEIEDLAVAQENGEIFFKLSVSGKADFDDVAELLTRLV